MVQVGGRRDQARRQPVRDRDRQGVDGGALDQRRRACRDPRAGGRGGAGRRRRRRHLRRRGRGAFRVGAKPAPGCRLVNAAHRQPARSPAAPTVAADPARGAPIKLDPFFEVRTPARNYGPARLAGGTRVTPLARRLAAEAGIDLGRFRRPGRTAASWRATSRRPPALRRRGAARPRRSPRPRAPTRSRRSTATCRSRKCRSTACARPSPRGCCRPSRPSRISI